MTRKLSLTVDGRNVAVHLHQGDLPQGVTFSGPVAVDSETLGLSLVRDPLCLVQLRTAAARPTSSSSTARPTMRRSSSGC